MVEKILLAHPLADQGPPLCTTLREQGFLVHAATDLPQATRLLQEVPALLLLDAELAHRSAKVDWNGIERHCQNAQIPCLVFSSNGMTPAQIWQLAPWGAGVIRHPDDAAEVLAAVESQLQIRRLTQELNLAHRLVQKKQLELRQYRDSAAQIQKSLLPTRFPTSDSLQFAWRFLPCEQVGGDLFNVLHLTEDTVMAYLLDVSGHGISAAMVSVSVSQSLSPHTGVIVRRPLETPHRFQIQDPAEVLTELDGEYPFERFEKFFTITYLLVNTRTGEVRYSSAGHPPPVVVRRDGTLEQLTVGGPIIGMGGVESFAEGRMQLAPGDRLYLYSDGITEYTGAKGELFGNERFFGKLVRQRKRSLEATCSKVIDALYAFGHEEPPQDDVTLLGIAFNGRGSGEK